MRYVNIHTVWQNQALAAAAISMLIQNKENSCIGLPTTAQNHEKQLYNK